MLKETNPRRNKLPKRTLWFGSAIMATAAIFSACEKDGKEPSPTPLIPTTTIAGEQLETPSLIQTPELVQTPEATKVPEVKTQIGGKILVETAIYYAPWSDKPSEHKLWYIDLLTTESVLITKQLEQAPIGSYIKWSPSGDKFAARLEDKQNRWDVLGIFDLKGNLLAKFGDITSEPFISPWDVSWSPDGKSIICQYESGIFLLKWEENQFDQIVKNEEANYPFWNPASSPDGKKLVFGYNAGDELEIAVIDIDPGKFPYLWNKRDQENFSEGINIIYKGKIDLINYGRFRFHWSPDSQNVFFSLDDGSTTGIFAADTTARTAKEIVKANCEGHPLRTSDDWALSPDGQKIVYSCSIGEHLSGGIYLVDSSGDNLRKILNIKSLPLEVNSDTFLQPRWLDNKRIMFISGDSERNVYMINTDNSEVQLVLTSPEYEGIESFHLSPK